MAEESIDAVELLRQHPGDPDAIGRVWDGSGDTAARVVRLRMDHRLQGRIDASDVLQEAFIDFQARSTTTFISPICRSSYGCGS